MSYQDKMTFIHDRTQWTAMHTFCFSIMILSAVERLQGSRLRREYQENVKDPRLVRIRKGRTALLRCDVKHVNAKAPAPYVIEWFRHGAPVFIKVGKHPPHINRDFEGRMSIAGDSTVNASLLISNVTESDDGWYECRVLFLQERFENSSNGTWVKLEVTDPPSFQETPPRSKIARQGQSLLLKCRAKGRPQPVITWRKDGRLVKDGQNGILLSGGDLAVTKLTTSHRGKYTCRAQSVEGQIQFTTTVRVEAPPEFIEKPADTTAEEGKDAMFSCRAMGYPQRMKYSWSYNGIPVDKSPVVRGRNSVIEDGTLIIYQVSTKDKGIVTCTVDNGFGISPSASAALYVQFKARASQMPALVYAGFGLKAVLNCPSEAEPPVNRVTWRKNGVPMSPHQDPRTSLNANGSLILTSASQRDAGRYTCTPYNILGTLGESTGTRLVIRDPPYFTLAPKPTYVGEIGKTLVIPCKGYGDPPPAVSWLKILSNGESLEYRVDFGNLTIPIVTKEMHGKWKCILKNSVAEVTKEVQILVKYTSPHKVTNVTAQALSNTAIRISWSPGYNGGYPQRFMLWYKQAEKGDPSWLTSQVEGSHTVAVVENLLPNTAYELAVLPENRIRSGPFSDTVIVKTLSRPPIKAEAAALLPPPQALFASQTEEGYIQLSWRKPRVLGAGRSSRRRWMHAAPSPFFSKSRIMGFLVEYRWTGVDPLAASDEVSSLKTETRTRRSTYYQRLRATLEKEERILSRRKRAADPSIPDKNKWVTLTTTYENVTTIVVKPTKLYRDLVYDFRVLTVSKNEYSTPSNPVTVSTKGLAVYPCYSGPLDSAALFGHPVVAGVLTAVCLVAVLVIIGIICVCKRRKRKMKKGFEHSVEINAVDVTPQVNNLVDGDNKPNGKLVGDKHPIVVDLTNGGPGGYNTVGKREYESPCSEDDAKIPFVNNNNDQSNDDRNIMLFSPFREQRDMESKEDERKDKERTMSDRSSVRMRRETAARILSEQFKRRSLTEHSRFNIKKDMPLRGGIRSASASPERSSNIIFERPDRLNVTSPAALEAPPSRRKIRLYSRPIDDPSSSQQRHMIVIKRKSQKSSSSGAGRVGSSRAPPSDSSESPVFGVVGTINQSGDEKRENNDAITPSSFLKQSITKNTSSSHHTTSSSTGLRELFSPRHRSPVEDDVFSGSDGINNKSDDGIISRGGDVTDTMLSSWGSPISPPLSASSPKDVSPNHVAARHTVAYDPTTDLLSSPEWCRQWDYGERDKMNSLNRKREGRPQYGRAQRETTRISYSQSPYADIAPQGEYRSNYGTGYDRYPPRKPSTPVYQPQPNYRRLSLSQQPMIHANKQQPAQYHPGPSVNHSRSRASYAYGHKPLTLFSPAKVVDRFAPVYDRSGAGPTGASSPIPSSEQPQPPSTFEIDCSNSDIEVRFIKDPNGSGYVQAPRDAPGFVTSQLDPGREMVIQSPYVRCVQLEAQFSAPGPAKALQNQTEGKQGLESNNTCAPSSGDSGHDLHYNLRDMPTSPNTKKVPGSSPNKSTLTQDGISLQPKQQSQRKQSERTKSPTAVRPRNLLSPTRSSVSSPVRHAKLKTGSGSEPPTSPPLAAIGSSDYGSQDTSNSSTSPTAGSKNTASPSHRILGIPQERPPRRDNSSVEDNYEWDSEIAMEGEILEALRHFGTLKKSGPVSDELLDELNKFTKDTKELMQRQRPQSADLLWTPSPNEKDEKKEDGVKTLKPLSPEPNYTKESMARRCAALRAEFLHYQQLQQLDEDDTKQQ